MSQSPATLNLDILLSWTSKSGIKMFLFVIFNSIPTDYLINSLLWRKTLLCDRMRVPGDEHMVAVDHLTFITSIMTPHTKRPTKHNMPTCNVFTAGVQAFKASLIEHLEEFHMNSHQELLLTKRQKEHLPKHVWCLENNCFIHLNLVVLFFNRIEKVFF